MGCVLDLKNDRVRDSAFAEPRSGRFRVGVSISVSTLLLMGGILELVKNSAIAFRYGSGAETDAFFAAYLIPATYAMFWISACTVGLVPLLTRRLNESKDDGSALVGSILIVCGCSTALFAGLGYFAAPVLMKLLVPGFGVMEHVRAVTLFRALTPLFLLAGLIGVVGSVLNSLHKFLLPAAQKIVVNVIVLAGIVAGSAKLDVEWLARLIVMGTFFYAVLMFVALARAGLSLNCMLELRASEIAGVLGAILLPFIALTIRQSSSLIDRALASFFAAGGISSLSYSFQVVGGFSSVIGAGLTVVLLPFFAGEKSSRTRLGLVGQGFDYLLTALLPLSVGAFLLSRAFVSLLLYHGAFSAANAVEATGVFRAYSFSMVFPEMAALFQVPFWADRRFRLLITHNGLMALANVVLDLLLAPRFGVAGLALGFTLTGVVSCTRMIRLLQRTYGPVLTSDRLKRTLKPLAATAAMAIVVTLIRGPVASLVFQQHSQFYNEVLRTTILTLVGVVTYVVGGVATQMEPFPKIYGGFQNALSRLQTLADD